MTMSVHDLKHRLPYGQKIQADYYVSETCLWISVRYVLNCRSCGGKYVGMGLVTYQVPYHFKIFKGCLSQILLGPFMNALPHVSIE